MLSKGGTLNAVNSITSKCCCVAVKTNICLFNTNQADIALWVHSEAELHSKCRTSRDFTWVRKRKGLNKFLCPTKSSSVANNTGDRHVTRKFWCSIRSMLSAAPSAVPSRESGNPQPSVSRCVTVTISAMPFALNSAAAASARPSWCSNVCTYANATSMHDTRHNSPQVFLILYD